MSESEAYCVKCRAKREMSDPKEVTSAKGRKMMQGKCPECGTKMTRFMKGDKTNNKSTNKPVPAVKKGGRKAAAKKGKKKKSDSDSESEEHSDYTPSGSESESESEEDEEEASRKKKRAATPGRKSAKTKSKK